MQDLAMVGESEVFFSLKWFFFYATSVSNIPEHNLVRCVGDCDFFNFRQNCVILNIFFENYFLIIYNFVKI